MRCAILGCPSVLEVEGEALLLVGKEWREEHRVSSLDLGSNTLWLLLLLFFLLPSSPPFPFIPLPPPPLLPPLFLPFPLICLPLPLFFLLLSLFFFKSLTLSLTLSHWLIWSLTNYLISLNSKFLYWKAHVLSHVDYQMQWCMLGALSIPKYCTTLRSLKINQQR